MKKTLLFFLLCLILGVSVSAYFWYRHHQSITLSVSQPTPIAVKVAPVQYHSLPIQVHSLGELLTSQNIMLTAQQPGKISALYFKSGQQVKEGQLLVKINDIAEKAAVANAAADLKAKYINYQRYLNAAEGSVIKLNLTIAKGAYEVAKATLAEKQKSLADTQIRAPFSGKIGALQTIQHQVGSTATYSQIAPGAFVQIGTAIAPLVNSHHILVQYLLPQQYSGELKLGQQVQVTTSAYPNKIFKGEVTFISPVVDSMSQSYEVRAAIDNSNSQLKSGMSVAVTHTLAPHHQVLAIPGLSLVPTIDGYSVYTVVNNKIKSVPVKIGSRHDTLIAITSGLSAGQKIVVSGMQNVHLGSLVKVVP